jgi:peptidoglycan/xylan/chitin deacetylase (PgdA/CDA1 family)
MNIIPAKTPGFAKSLFPNFVWDIPTDHKTLYLTFDDGPTPVVTEWVLQTLQQFNAKGTFFCIGNNIKTSPDIFSTIIDNGHAIGNHTFNHLKGWNVKTDDYLNDVILTDNLITTLIRPSCNHQKMFRPPYGKFKSAQSNALQEQGYRIVLWDVLSFDGDKRVSPEQCLNNVISKAKPGSIVVFHDSLKAERNLKYVLPKVLEHFSDRGYSFKAIH